MSTDVQFSLKNTDFTLRRTRHWRCGRPQGPRDDLPDQPGCSIATPRRPKFERSGRTAGCGACREGLTASPQLSRPTVRRLSDLRCRTQDVFRGALPGQSVWKTFLWALRTSV